MDTDDITPADTSETTTTDDVARQAATSQLWTQEVADTYDENSADMFAPEVLGPTVDFLVDRAAGGRALEFAIGTGRVGMALADRGVEVAGIEFSPAMADVLSAKPGSDRIELVVGDMATATVPGTFSLVYLVFNTISNLLTQQAQVACFRNAARHLEPGGAFVVELGVPQLQRLPPGETARPFEISEDHLGFDTFDLVTQRLVSHHYRRVEGDGVGGAFRSFLSRHRWAWPAELDLMAELAGMTPTERWADWRQNPFTADSPSHVSVWRTPTR